MHDVHVLNTLPLTVSQLSKLVLGSSIIMGPIYITASGERYSRKLKCIKTLKKVKTDRFQLKLAKFAKKLARNCPALS